MVAVGQLGESNRLALQSETLDRALASLNAGGQIVNMTISSTPLPPPQEGQPLLPSMLPISVDTRDIYYPPQMIEGVKSQLQAQKAAIDAQLRQMGITGT